ncbi:MAG: DUF1611 domain-containing protein [Candidatus Omnitrophica bacterium]|nr:DUF1611 domain-containing protein [Candidatus Omnitrophota bacterium]
MQEKLARKKILFEHQLKRAKASFNSRRVELSHAKYLLTDTSPRAGDLVLAQIKQISQHSRIHLRDGRRARLYPGDEVILSYANRYAVDQFEAEVPNNLSRCHMVAAGGVASKVISKSFLMKNPTVIKPIGLMADAYGKVINIKDYALPQKRIAKDHPAIVVAVVGTEMNSGKTLTASCLIRSAVWAGLRVVGIKVTGTGAAGDFSEMVDAGAHGVLQQETHALISRSVFKENVDGVVLAASDLLAAKAAAEVLTGANLPLMGVSGYVAGSQIGCRTTKKVTGYDVFNKNTLCSASMMLRLLPKLSVDQKPTLVGGRWNVLV